MVRAVAVDPALSCVIADAKNRGAAHITPLPMAEQCNKPSPLWHYLSRLSAPLATASSKDSSCSTDMLLMMEDTLSGDDFMNFDDLDLGPLVSEFDYTASFHTGDEKLSALPDLYCAPTGSGSSVSSGEVR